MTSLLNAATQYNVYMWFRKYIGLNLNELLEVA